MSYDIADPRSSQFYLDFDEIGGIGKFCTSELTFNYPIISASDQYCVHVERFSIPLGLVPYRDAIPNCVKLTPVGQGEDSPGSIVYSLIETYSLAEFLTSLNSFVSGLEFILTNGGRMKVSYNDFTTYYILLDQQLVDIFQFGTRLLESPSASASFIGAGGVVDRIDQLHSIRIETNTLNPVSELLTGSVEGSIISDFLVPSSFSISVNANNNNPADLNAFSFTCTPRQDVILTPQYLRPINLRGRNTLYNLRVRAIAKYKDGRLIDIPLPSGSRFSCKVRVVKVVK